MFRVFLRLERVVDIQSSMLAQLFVLYPVIIQGWVSPVKPPAIADGGIPKSIYDDQLKGLECLVDPWAELQMRSSTMAADDRVDLYVNDEPNPVTGHTVKAGEEHLRIALYVPHGRLRHGVNRLHYKVKRASGNGSEDSRDLNVLYHLRLADGLELLFPPEIEKNGVGAEEARKGVEATFKYNNRRSFDRIRCLIGDATVEFDVPDAPAPITKTLFTDIFEQAGDHPNSIVEFQLFDQLGNVVFSSQQYLDIHLKRETAGPVGEVPLGMPQRGIAISPDGSRAYVGHGGSISVIDTTTNRVVDSIITSNTRFFAGIFVTPDGAKVYAASTGPHEVLVINAATNAVINRISAQGTFGHAAMTRDGNYLFIHTNSNTVPGAIRVIDTRSDQIIRTFTTKTYTAGAALSPDGKIFYYNEYSSSSSVLVAIDSETGQRLKEVTVPNSRGGLDIDSSGNRIYLYTQNQVDSRMLEIDANSFQTLRTFNGIPPSSYSGAFSPDRSLLCVSVYEPLGKCLFLDLQSGQLIGSANAGSYPMTSAFTPDGRLYLCSNRDFLLVIKPS
jgi:YVTN family beta-propeller protein